MKRKREKTPRQKLEAKLDRLFSRLVRQSGADSQGICTCASCGEKRHWKAIDCGHYYSRKHRSVRWDARNARPQCKGCNSGFKRRIRFADPDDKIVEKLNEIRNNFAKTLRREGVDTIRLAEDARQIKLWTLPELEEMADEFEELIEQNGFEK